MHLSKLTIKQKLYFAFLFMAAVTFVVAFMCASNLSSNINAVFDTKTTLAKNLVVVSNVQQTMSELDGAVSACATDPVSNKAKADSLSMLVTDFKSAMNNFSFKEYKDDVARITAAANEYVSEDMIQVFGGLYIKSFVLFYGEKINYYIMEFKGEDTTITSSEEHILDDRGINTSLTRYGRLNDLLVCSDMKEDTISNLITDYYVNNEMVKELFLKS